MTWLFALAIIGVAAFFAYDRHSTCVALIEGELKKRHATNITASFQWFDWDRDNFTYEVSYVDAAGKTHLKTCKVRSSRIPGDDAIYWAGSLDA